MSANTHSLDLESGSSQYATAADSVSLSLAGDFTIEFWVKFESLPSVGSQMYLISKGRTDQPDRGYYLYLDNSAGTYTMNAEVNQDASGGTRDNYKWTITPSLGIWYHYAVTCTIANASATTFEFFLNTASQGNGTAVVAGNASSINNNDDLFVIGAHESSSIVNFTDGIFDEVRIWSDVRTPTEILTYYNTELVGNEANLSAYWKLNNSLLDETANNNDLTASGSPVFSVVVPFTNVLPSGGSPMFFSGGGLTLG